MLDKFFTNSNLFIIALFISALALLVHLYTSAGIKSSETDGVVVIHFADNISPAHQKIINRFNKKYHNSIKVAPVNLPFTKFSTNERKQLFTRTLRSKSTRVDIFAVDLVWVPRFTKWCAPLTNYFSSEEQNNFLPYALQSCFYKGQLVSVPLYIDIGVLYYRRDILQKLDDFEAVEQRLQQSITWEELIKLHKRLSKSGKPSYIFPADNYEGLICSFVETMGGTYSSLFKYPIAMLTKPPVRKGLELLVSLVNQYKVSPPEVTGFRENDAYLYALEHDIPFFRGWPGNLRPFHDKYAEKIRHIALAPLPHFKGDTPAAVFGGWNLMISKFSDKKEAAIKFLKFVTSAEMQKLLFKEMGFIPVNKKVYQDSVFMAENPELQFFHSYFYYGFHRPQAVEYTKISDILSHFLNMAIKREISVNDALNQAAVMIESKRVLIK